MAILSYVEFKDLPKMGSGHFTPAVPGKTLGYGQLDYSSGEANATLSVSTRAVYVSTDAICRVRLDGTATATTGYRLAAGQFLIIAGDLTGATLSAISGS